MTRALTLLPALPGIFSPSCPSPIRPLIPTLMHLLFGFKRHLFIFSCAPLFCFISMTSSLSLFFLLDLHLSFLFPSVYISTVFFKLLVILEFLVFLCLLSFADIIVVVDIVVVMTVSLTFFLSLILCCCIDQCTFFFFVMMYILHIQEEMMIFPQPVLFKKKNKCLVK